MEIIPAILESNIEAIQHRLHALEGHHVPIVQLDVTDGSITSQTSWHDPAQLAELHWHGEFELHLMQADPPVEAWLQDSRVSRCVIHAESSNPAADLRFIKTRGRLAGLALNPPTPMASVQALLAFVDYVLLLTVTPGAQGQGFQRDVLRKVKELHGLAPEIAAYADGGINEKTIRFVQKAECAGCAVGSYLWRAADPVAALEGLRQAANYAP